jgi:hypothetical protein
MVPKAEKEFDAFSSWEGPRAGYNLRSLFMNNSSVHEEAAAQPVEAVPIEAAATGEGSVRPADAGAGPTGPAKKKPRIEHKIPGRIRMRIPHAKTDPAILETYTEIFSTIPGVTKVKPKPTTGSIIIHYDPEREAAVEKQLNLRGVQSQMVATMRPGDEIEIMANKIKAEAEFLAERFAVAKTAVDFCRNLDHQLKATTGNAIDLKIMLAGGLAAYTVWQIGAQAAVPICGLFALYAVNHYIELQDELPAAAAIPAGNR